MGIFNKLYKELLTEKKKGTHVYVDKTDKGMQLSTKEPNTKKKIPLDIKNLKGFINTLDTNTIDVNKFHCQFEYTNGNSKLGKDTIIVNMGAATDCPSAKASLCELYANGLCYANNQERGITGKGILPAKRRHGKQWAGNDATTIAFSLAGIITKLRQKRDIKYVRMNEAGDFRTLEDVEKLKNVVIQTNKILDKPVVFYNYTHRSDLFPMGRSPLEGVENFVLQGSGYRKDLTVKADKFETGKLGRTVRPAEKKEGKRVAFMLDNCFYALQYSDFKSAKFGSTEDANRILPYGVTKEQVVQCPGDCFYCDQCKTGGKKFIVIVIHGMGAEAKDKTRAVTLALGKRAKTKTTASNNLPLEDNEIINLYTSLGRNDYAFIDKLYEYYAAKQTLLTGAKVTSKITVEDIYDIWNRLEYLRSIAKNTKDAQSKDWIMPNKTGKSTLEEPLEKYLLALQAKNSKKDKKEEPITEAKKHKEVDLMSLDPVQLANLAVSGTLAKYPQFVSPKDIEDEMEDLETQQPTVNPVVQTTESVIKESYNTQKKIEKILKEGK